MVRTPRRLVFAAMTIAFVAVSALVLGYGLFAEPHTVGTVTAAAPGQPPLLTASSSFQA